MGNILNDSDNETIDVLSLLFSQGGVLRGETIGENKYVEKSSVSPRAKRMAKGDIRHYFERKNMSPPKDGQKFNEWCEKRVDTLKKQASKLSFNE